MKKLNCKPRAYEIKVAGLDGSSKAKAIIINAKNEDDGVRQEYLTLDRLLGNYEFLGQTLIHDGDKSYDIIRIKWKDRNINIWFDITDFFGKWI